MLTIRNTEAIRQIEAAIGYTFRDKRLLVQVLTRKTYLKIDPEAPDNEVLEFYGDTLMNYHVTNYFMAKYAHMLEDGLFFMRTVEQFTDLRSHYVCNRYLTERVKALGLARHLRAQNRDAELRRDGEKAYADIFESLVGAIYLDSYQNDDLIRAFILRQLGIEPKRLPAEIEAFDYDAIAHDTPEDISFPCDEPDEAMIPDEPAAEIISTPAEAVDAVEEAPLAETAALLVAEAATEVIPQLAPAEIPSAEEITALTAEVAAEIPALVAEAAPTTSREKLAILCEQLGFEQPTYGETPPNAPNARPVAACTLRFKDAKGKQIKISLNDSGKTLAEATEKAAAKMLAKVEKHTAEAQTEAPAKPTVKAEKPAKPAKFKAEKQTAKAEAPAEVIPAPVEETATAEVAVAEATAAENTVTEAVTEAAPAPVETVEVEPAPTEKLPVAETPVEETPAEEAPVAETPVEEIPAEEKPVADAPVEEIPSETATVTEASAEAASVEKVGVADAPAEEIPVEVTPAEKKPAKKSSAKKKAAPKKKAETPAEEIPASVQPVEEKSVSKSPTRKKPSSKKKVEADTVAPETPAEAPTEILVPAPVAEDKPAEVKKPRAPRKPKVKKDVPAEAKTDAE